MKKNYNYIKYTIMTVIVFALFFAMGSGISTYMKITSMGTDTDNYTEDAVSAAEEGERTNILVLGVDARPGDDHSRSDTMILVSIDPKLDKAAVISIPRDTRVNVPGSPLDKICTANYAGGPEYAVEIVEDFMGVNIDYYIEADFNGFESVIDTLGGVTINVPQRMYKPSEGIDLYPGNQKLDGKQALAFVRYRGYEYGDIERTNQQQDFVIALADELLQPKTVIKLPALIKEVREYVSTDIALSDMLKMASWAPGFDSSSLITQTLPGYFYDLYNDEDELEQSYWIADQEEAARLIENMFAGQTVAVIQASPFPVYVPSQDDEEDTEESNLVDINEARANLPSPGHNGELDAESVLSDNSAEENNDVADLTGPEGYI